MGSTFSARSVVSIIGACRFDGSCASGTVPWASGFLGVHWFAPAGLVVSSQSYLNRLSRYPLSHVVGLSVQAPSIPLVTVSSPLPVPKVFLQPPEDLIGFPDVGPPEAEAERLESHLFHGHVAGEDQEIGPGDLAAVLLLDRPEQAARLVEARVVGPAVEGGEALRAFAAAA